MRRRRSSTLVPYTTLFRSTTCPGVVMSSQQSVGCSLIIHWREPQMPTTDDGMQVRRLMQKVAEEDVTPDGRSEEHTSELQSQFQLVCRLLLEKKKVVHTPA